MSSTYVRGLSSSGSSLASNRFSASQVASHFSWTDLGSHFSCDCPDADVCWWPAAATSALSTAVIVSSRLLTMGRTLALALVLVSKKPLAHEGQPRQRFRESARLTKEQHGATHEPRISHAAGTAPSKPHRPAPPAAQARHSSRIYSAHETVVANRIIILDPAF